MAAGDMDCLECRRLILADPSARSAKTAAHLDRCAACSAFLQRARGLDARLADVISIEPPADMAARILGSTLLAHRRRRRLITAAAILMTGSAVVGSMTTEEDGELALAAIDFVIGEEANAILAGSPADPAQLGDALRALGARLPPQLGRLHYLGLHVFAATKAHHIIASTPRGKATLLLLPALGLARAQSAAARGLCAVIRPSGSGSVAVIGDSRPGIARICAMVWT